jgi:hypothetical protein
LAASQNGYALFKSIFSLKAAVKELHSNFQVHEQGDAASFCKVFARSDEQCKAVERGTKPIWFREDVVEPS